MFNVFKRILSDIGQKEKDMKDFAHFVLTKLKIKSPLQALTNGFPNKVLGYLDNDSSVVMNFSPPQSILTSRALLV